MKLQEETTRKSAVSQAGPVKCAPTFGMGGAKHLIGTFTQSDNRTAAFYPIVQRTLDLAVSMLVLIASLPMILLIGILIKLDSPGPVLFKHTRVGINRRRCGESGYEGAERRRINRFGQPFSLYKFRTMFHDAAVKFPELYTYSYSLEDLATLPIKVLTGNKQTANDPRITRVGRWLRRTSLDELPNFVSVLKGDMHLVGPRPDITQNIHYYSVSHIKKLEVKPGLTGLAQIRGRGNLSFLQTNECDLEYVQNRSFLLDLKILLKTIAITLKAQGAY